MTPEEKQLLLKVLCAMLPYGVKCRAFTFDFVTLLGIDNGKLHLDYPTYGEDTDYFDIEFVRPALRPMSSMTEEEKKEYTSYCFEQPFLQKDKTPNLGSVPMCIDWLNKNMFDYRGLIPMGLALEAPKDMYKDS